jgi:hypothetical protein
MMLSVAVSLLSGNLKSGANSGAKSTRDLCSTGSGTLGSGMGSDSDNDNDSNSDDNEVFHSA